MSVNELVYMNVTQICVCHSALSRGAEYCDERVCVCLIVCSLPAYIRFCMLPMGIAVARSLSDGVCT